VAKGGAVRAGGRRGRGETARPRRAAAAPLTYGSTSPDLVHSNRGLSRTANNILLGLVELLALRSGHAYQAAYHQWYEGRDHNDFGLGAVQFVQVEPDTWVANMVGQHGVRSSGQTPPIRYEALEECLSKLARKARELDATVHMPRIGCGLAGGKWARVERLVVKTLSANDVPVTVYDL
jgi:hypothetical protein